MEALQRRRVRPRRFALVLGALTLVVALGALGAAVFSPLARGFVNTVFWVEDPAFTRDVARAMTDYALPPGYGERRALELQGVRTAVLGSLDQPATMLIVLATGMPGLDDPQYREAVEASWARSLGERRYDTRLVDTRAVLVRGTPTTLSLREGRDDRGEPVRQATAIFLSRQGPALLMVVGRPEHWDQQLVDQFIGSMR